MFKTTAQHTKWWANRKIDWEKHYLATWNHPHREYIMEALRSIPWISLWEVGCGPGANIAKVVRSFKDKNLGGSDINADAIELARTTFTGGRFKVESSEDMLLSDDSVDVVLSDASLIYISPGKIRTVIHEMARIARNHLVLCEFHGGTWWSRLWLRLTTGYNAYDYQKLLEEEGCHNIQIVKLPPEAWDGFPWQPWGHIIIARVTKL